MTDHEKYADKIAKLLRKAETTTPQEAEALVAKAQQLMTQYAIDEEMIARARGEERRTKIIEGMIEFTGIYAPAIQQIGSVIGRANDCRMLVGTRHEGRTKIHQLYLIGFEEDVERAKMLNASLQIQATGAQGVWWKEHKDQYEWMSGMEKFKSRRDFLFGFARGLQEQLTAAKQRGQADAVVAEAARSEVSSDEASKSIALVLRSKKQRVDDWMDEHYGRLSRGRGGNYSRGMGGMEAGRAAGRSADVGRPGVGRSKGVLTR